MNKNIITLNLIIFFLVGIPRSFSQEVFNNEYTEDLISIENVETLEISETQTDPQDIDAENSISEIVSGALETEVVATEQETIEPIEILKTENIKPSVTENRKKTEMVARKITRDIEPDQNPIHTCKPSIFSVNLKNRSEYQMSLLVENPGEHASQSIEIGSLPKGIDLYFVGENKYKKMSEENKLSVEVKISKDPEAQKGSFNVLFIHTSKTLESESVSICQVNLINY